MSAQIQNWFDQAFAALTGKQPFPWQRRLFGRFIDHPDEIPDACSLPTGLGKTAIIAIWLLALAHHGGKRGFPRRLAYVVNRRTVVDQATREAEKIRKNLCAEDASPVLVELRKRLTGIGAIDDGEPFAISTLRGQFADNRRWARDPARAAVIVGTVDMIGSRLLFSGYGIGFRRWPHHAGLLGQDTLIVHDEAHLEPAFQRLLVEIRDEQQHEAQRSGLVLQLLRVMELSATSRGASEDALDVFELDADDRKHSTVKLRLNAKKGIAFHLVDDEKKLADKMVEIALTHRESGLPILIFARTVETVEKIASQLHKAKLPCATLTGTMRGFERELLTEGRNDDSGKLSGSEFPWAKVFARFLPTDDVSEHVTPHPGTVYLVCTSAGEVGVNISGAHLICDLACYDSIAQRLGRVNRFGEGDARVDIVFRDSFDGENKDDGRRKLTLRLLRLLPPRDDGRHEASPQALSQLGQRKDLPCSLLDAFTPPPVILPLGDILLDAWSLTTIREPLPGRPPVADWLHGVADDQPVTYFAWRGEVAETEFILDASDDESAEFVKGLAEYLDGYPIRTHEQLQIPAYRAVKQLKMLAERQPSLPAWVVDGRGAVQVVRLEKLAELEVGDLNERTILLPSTAGGLTNQGLFDGGEAYRDDLLYDVADLLLSDARPPRYRCVWNGDIDEPSFRYLGNVDVPTPKDGAIPGFKRLPEIELAVDAEGNTRKLWAFVFRKSLDDDETRSRYSRKEQFLQKHLDRAGELAGAIGIKLGMQAEWFEAVRLAAALHDLGKNRKLWQRSIGNPRRDDAAWQPWAKSGRKKRIKELEGYRHEFGSLLDLPGQPGFEALSAEMKELVLHVVAAHHGRGRPHFPMRNGVSESYDAERPEEDSAKEAGETVRRFARLQRRYGRWGLAWLESLVRAADYLASEEADQGEEVPS